MVSAEGVWPLVARGPAAPALTKDQLMFARASCDEVAESQQKQPTARSMRHRMIHWRQAGVGLNGLAKSMERRGRFPGGRRALPQAEGRSALRRTASFFRSWLWLVRGLPRASAAAHRAKQIIVFRVALRHATIA